MRHTLMFFLALCSTGLCQGAEANAGQSEWSSAPCSTVAIGPGPELSHVQRIFLLGDPDYTIQYKYFADAACTLPMYSMVFKGRSQVSGVSHVVARAKEVEVRIDRLLFTLDSPRGATAARQCADGKFDVGVQRDVSEQTCMQFKPKSACGVDFELVGIENGVLTPGVRTPDMCSAAGRPTRLQSAGARWIGEF